MTLPVLGSMLRFKPITTSIVSGCRIEELIFFTSLRLANLLAANKHTRISYLTQFKLFVKIHEPNPLTITLYVYSEINVFLNTSKPTMPQPQHVITKAIFYFFLLNLGEIIDHLCHIKCLKACNIIFCRMAHAPFLLASNNLLQSLP